jgi:hypothetical protein
MNAIRMNRSCHRPGCHAGFTRTELLVVALTVAILGVLLVGAGRGFVTKARRIRCISNLAQIGTSFGLWSGDALVMPGAFVETNVPAVSLNAARVFQVMSNELVAPRILVCPSDTRWVAASFVSLSDSNVSYFVNLDTSEEAPEGLLTGDRNLLVNGQPAGTGRLTLTRGDEVTWTEALHRGCGNVGLADGSMRQLSGTSLSAMLKSQSTSRTAS